MASDHITHLHLQVHLGGPVLLLSAIQDDAAFVDTPPIWVWLLLPAL